ncbi:hypothetical protein A6V39_01620 [Candidatus Mycoplasma haematobovis]|uniref:Uncharacterized protein n=1 Tax=Candidatus Mycoplasma haematobovis TaxID=432608 RepID=A0A1A9QFF7_9MOLU|nr:hypothetical protein [Candidatus Mycoplasma haematobovis]OAL10741.1 hypothetical protein A6V39_01620 [Candidatus Mycoplasma haematobovis]
MSFLELLKNLSTLVLDTSKQAQKLKDREKRLKVKLDKVAGFIPNIDENNAKRFSKSLRDLKRDMNKLLKSYVILENISLEICNLSAEQIKEEISSETGILMSKKVKESERIKKGLQRINKLLTKFKKCPKIS